MNRKAIIAAAVAGAISAPASTLASDHNGDRDGPANSDIKEYSGNPLPHWSNTPEAVAPGKPSKPHAKSHTVKR
jgi:hypothetical protein